jgi:hypothetical protein
MRETTDKQEPSGKEGGQVQVGDTVWVRAKVAEVDNTGARLTTEVYGQSFCGIECIEAIKAATGDGFPDYLRGNVMKYLWRYKEKGGVDDLRKSAWYLDRLIKEVGE